ncbi:hypothetical protein FBUS_03445 [Fasciolopsis buskii]|uniref:RING-type domain-containing protein n=1 Tax=Fasciolopsis buskii TaxID=27845 RepID=A0A8E0RWL0_9TREM|nr:hypothetical protein FBUS_03445 [Fasciolopsis buski]
MLKSLSTSDVCSDGGRLWQFNICSCCNQFVSSHKSSLVSPSRLARMVATRQPKYEDGLRLLLDYCPQLFDALTQKTIIELWSPQNRLEKRHEAARDPDSKISRFLLCELHTRCLVEQQTPDVRLLEQMDEQFMQLLLTSPTQMMDKHWGIVLTKNGISCKLCALNATVEIGRIKRSGLTVIPGSTGNVNVKPRVMVFPCQHAFHDTCLTQIRLNWRECPICVRQD